MLSRTFGFPSAGKRLLGQMMHFYTCMHRIQHPTRLSIQTHQQQAIFRHTRFSVSCYAGTSLNYALYPVAALCNLVPSKPPCRDLTLVCILHAACLVNESSLRCRPTAEQRRVKDLIAGRGGEGLYSQSPHH